MNIPADFVPRETYLQKVLPFINKPLAKLLVGQRRVGKSYLLFQIMAHLKKNFPDAAYHYINFEDFAFFPLRDAESLHKHLISIKKPGICNYLFIDEIQEVAQFELPIRTILLDPDWDVYLTGSNAELLSGELATRLAGRTIQIQVYSLSYPEFLQFHGLENKQENLITYLKYGGLPFLKHLKASDDIVFEYLQNIYQTVVYRDVVSRYGIRNTKFLEQLIHYVADTTGALFSANTISAYLKSQKVNLAHNQVGTYIHHLVQACIIHETIRYDIKGKRIFETGAKYYFQDSGLRNAIAGYREADLGKLTENAIQHHLLHCGYNLYVGISGDKEIDFIAEKNNERIYIQACLMMQQETTIDREYAPLLQLADQFPKMVVTLYGSSRNTIQGIKHLSLLDFLSKSW